MPTDRQKLKSWLHREELDDRKNARADRGERDIAGMDSRVRLLVVPTDEELAIARDTLRLTAAH